MVITFLVPTAPRPQGGIMAIYEFANALARLGHEVNLVHLNSGGGEMSSPDEITWCELIAGSATVSRPTSGTRTYRTPTFSQVSAVSTPRAAVVRSCSCRATGSLQRRSRTG